MWREIYFVSVEMMSHWRGITEEAMALLFPQGGQELDGILQHIPGVISGCMLLQEFEQLLHTPQLPGHTAELPKAVWPIRNVEFPVPVHFESVEVSSRTCVKVWWYKCECSGVISIKLEMQMCRITFGHAVRPFDNITRRWLSLHDISPETP